MPTHPNILFILTDQHRADMLSCAGSNFVQTPNIDLLAQEGVRFTESHCTTPLCMPSRATYFTGRGASLNGCYGNRILLDYGGDHLITRLREKGYQLALAGKNHAFTDGELEHWDFTELYAMHGKEDEKFGSSARAGEKEVAEWRRNEIPFFEAAVHMPQPGDVSDDPTVAQTDHAIRFLKEARDRTRPFFLWLSYEAPHFPYVLPEPWFSNAPLEAMPGLIDSTAWQRGPERLKMQHAGLRMDEMNEQDVRRIQATYCQMIAMVDEQIGRVLEALEASGATEETLIVFAADHGDFWGHRGLVGKSNALYEDLLRIPTIWKGPGVEGGHLSSALIENTDWTPTLLDLLGFESLERIEGRSYADVLRGSKTEHRTSTIAESSLGLPAWPRDQLSADINRRDQLYVEEGVMWFVNRIGGMTRSVYAPPYKLIEHAEDPSEFYDLQADPSESMNLIRESKYRSEIEQLSSLLNASTSGSK